MSGLLAWPHLWLATIGRKAGTALVATVIVGSVMVGGPGHQIWTTVVDDGGGGGDGETLILPENQTFVCGNYPQPVDFELVKVTITQQQTRQDAFRSGGECTGTIARLEIDTWSADGIHFGPDTHDLVIEDGYVHSHGVCIVTVCGDVHVDGIQVLGGVNITMTLDINYPTATNSALFIACGGSCLQIPTNVICDGCTIRRSPEDNRTVRIYTSVASGVRNSTIYWCGNGPGCGLGPAIDTISSTQDPVIENNTILLSGGP